MTIPKEAIVQNIYFGIVQSLIIFFGDGPIKDAYHQKKKFN